MAFVNDALEMIGGLMMKKTFIFEDSESQLPLLLFTSKRYMCIKKQEIEG